MAVRSFSLLDDAEDVVLAQTQVLFAVDFHFRARVLAEEHGVAGFHVELSDLAVLEDLAVADGNDLALNRLFLGGVGDDDPTLAFLFFLDPLDDHAVLQRSYRHGWLLLLGKGVGREDGPSPGSPGIRAPSEGSNFFEEYDC